MNLVTRFLAARRDKLLMRLGCWLVCFSLVLGLMLPQQGAHALVAELSMTAVASVAGACGLNFVTQGMDKDALVSSVQRLIQEFLDTELGGMSIQDWLGNIWDVMSIAGKLVMGRPLTEEFVGFAQWVAGKYGTQVGENVVYCESSCTVKLADGTDFILSEFVYSSKKVVSLGTKCSSEMIPLVFASGYYIGKGDDGYFRFFTPSGSAFGTRTNTCRYLAYDVNENVLCMVDINSLSAEYLSTFSVCDIALTFLGDVVAVNELFSIDRAPSMSYIPEGIAAEQGVVLDVGAAAAMDLDLVLQGVLEDVLTGTLTSTMEVAGEAVVDPPAGEITDVDNLGLSALGQALTSRFPFSIPWDFFRAVQLLAAPAKAPYFEVDFMEPLADEVGGWKGSTKVVLDFSEYAIIGQISRWTSIIGFCLMLAGATKRLIWTA